MKSSLKIIVFGLLLVLFSCGKNTKKEKVLKHPEAQISVDTLSVNEEVLNQEISLKHPSEYNDTLVYTVQVGAFKQRKPSLENQTDVTVVEQNLLIKYRFGQFKSYKEATNFKKSILTLFPDAFIVPINKGTQIDIKEALKISNEISN